MIGALVDLVLTLEEQNYIDKNGNKLSEDNRFRNIVYFANTSEEMKEWDKKLNDLLESCNKIKKERENEK